MNNYEKEYKIYGILYTDANGDIASACVAAENSNKAKSLLESAVVEGKGYEYMKGSVNAEAKYTGFTTSKEGVIYGFDNRSGSEL